MSIAVLTCLGAARQYNQKLTTNTIGDKMTVKPLIKLYARFVFGPNELSLSEKNLNDKDYGLASRNLTPRTMNQFPARVLQPADRADC
jgi:hypothetical protein